MIARNHELRPEIEPSQRAFAASTLGEYSESMNATSAVLSADKTDDLGDTNFNAKKRRKRNRASTSRNMMDEPLHTKHALGHMHDIVHVVDNEENGRKSDKVSEPQSFKGKLTPIAHDTSVSGNPDNPELCSYTLEVIDLKSQVDGVRLVRTEFSWR